MSASVSSGRVVSSRSDAFYSVCTVCGGVDEDALPGPPSLTCLYCRATTHVHCAQAALAMTSLFCTELGVDTLTLVALRTGEARTAAGHRSNNPSVSPPASPTLPTQQQQQQHSSHGRVAAEPVFFCSADCALSVGLYANPHFSPELSGLVEAELMQRWRELAQLPDLTLDVLAAKRRDADKAVKEEEERSRANTHHHNGGNGEGDEDSRWETAVAAQNYVSLLETTYLQLRYDAWCRYGALERATVAVVPPLVPPSHLSLHEEVVGHVSDLVSAAGQAERLYMLACPVGSHVALPHDDVWRKVRGIAAGETNNFLAEAMLMVERTAVVPDRTTSRTTVKTSEKQ